MSVKLTTFPINKLVDGAGSSQNNFAKFAKYYRDTGVLEGVLNAWLVSENSPTGMSVLADTGQAFVIGFWCENPTTAQALAIAAADATNPRIDTIVLEMQNPTPETSNDGIYLRVITGTPAASPVPKTLTQTDTLYQFPLADVAVGAGVSVILDANITDRREFSTGGGGGGGNALLNKADGSSGVLQPGMVAIFDQDLDNGATTTTTERDQRALGIVSTAVGGALVIIVVGEHEEVIYDTGGVTPAYGDWLVTSGVAGKVMPVSTSTRPDGAIGVAKAAGAAGLVAADILGDLTRVTNIPGAIFVGGGYTTGAVAINSIKKFNGISWSNMTGTIVTAAVYKSAFSFSDKVYYSAGGTTPNNEHLQFVEDTATTKTVLPYNRSLNQHQGFEYLGKAHFVGGTTSVSFASDQNTHESYDTIGNSWATETVLTAVKSKGVGLSLDDKGYVQGGTSGSSTTVNTNYEWAGAWITRAIVTVAGAHAAGFAINGTDGYFLGGQTGSIGTDTGTVANGQNTNYEYDPDTWTTKQTFTTARSIQQSGVIGALGYIQGGYNTAAVFLQDLYRYDNVGNSWTLDTAGDFRAGGGAGSY